MSLNRGHILDGLIANLENVLGTKGYRPITPVVQVPAKVSAVHIVDRTTVVVLIKRVEKIGSGLESMIIFPAPRQGKILQKAEIRIPKS